MAGQPAGRRPGVVRFATEAILVGGLLVLYREGRHLAAGHVDVAQRNARRVWDLERTLHLPSEDDLQRLLLHSTALVRLADRYYVSVHFPITAAFLVWLWFRHHDSYGRVRLTLVLTTAIGLLFTVLVPLAPPRLFGGDGLEDTMQLFGPSAYNPNTTVGLANQYAAMPSLHVAWSVLIGVTVVAVSRRRVRWLALLHPLITTFVVVATANHYWADCIVGSVILGASAAVVYRPPLLVEPLYALRPRRASSVDAGREPPGAPAAGLAVPGVARATSGPDDSRESSAGVMTRRGGPTTS